ncbi:hypothetical protein CU086_00610 [Candidatus Nasuia deltocephalinicola]|uniref:Pseudouridine synthase RsuA/RluA-like domain-containing protein n=1 Tax=Candidatus Nasuia deltocephalincola TaxID=1160784 RepID=A0A974WN13_9PROT|nr:hypothetical protein CU086_00610 [Candidatus Nasuia deltocephalinicola]
MNFRIDFILCKIFFYFSRIDIKNIIFNNFFLYFFKFLFFKIKILLFFNFYNNYINKNLSFYIPIIYENNFFLIINKPFNLIIYNFLNINNLFKNLLYFYGKTSFELFRLGILNRLDKDTSGIMIVFKKNNFYINYLNQLKNKIIYKNYILYIFGFLKFGFYKIFNKYYSKKLLLNFLFLKILIFLIFLFL